MDSNSTNMNGNIGSKMPKVESSTIIVETAESKDRDSQPLVLDKISIGDPRTRSKVRFEVASARVVEIGGSKHVVYSVTMRLLIPPPGKTTDPRPITVDRRYSDFAYIYESILRRYQQPSIVLGDFVFPRKVLIGNFKAEVISERTDAFHRLLNLVSNCDNILYSEYFYAFLGSEEYNEAVSQMKMCRYTEAIPLLESVFFVREKLLTISDINVLQCLCELVSCLDAVYKTKEAYKYALVTLQSFSINQRGLPEQIEALRIPFLRLGLSLAIKLGQDKKQFDAPLSELRYAGVKVDTVRPLMDVIGEFYIYRASHTTKSW